MNSTRGRLHVRQPKARASSADDVGLFGRALGGLSQHLFAVAPAERLARLPALHARPRLAPLKRRIIPRIARCGVEPKNRLGRYRWVVERTLSWLNRFRRLKIRYEHRADIHPAFLQLGCALISLRFLG